MKQLLTLACLSLLGASPAALALSGGPFDNDSNIEGGGTGTYQGSFSGENLTGVFAFGFSASGGSNGRYAVFDRGVTRAGNMAALVNIPDRDVTAILTRDLATGSPGADGAFTAEIIRTFPIFTFQGEGRIFTAASPGTTTTSTVTTTNRFEDPPVAAGAAAAQFIQTISVTDATTQTTNQTVPFDVRGIRTSTLAGLFATTAIVGTPSTTGTAGGGGAGGGGGTPAVP